MKKSLILLLMVGLSLSAWSIVPPRSLADTAIYNRQLRQMQQAEGMAKAPMRVQAVGTRNLIQRVPVIMVNYQDMRYRVSRADVDSMFNAVHFTKYDATGSVRQYFNDQSYGEYNPIFDIYGPVTVSQNYANYAGKAAKLVLEACALMDDSLDFRLYDLDGNNKVDLLFCLFAGPPSSDAEGIDPSWISNPDKLLYPHYWTIDAAGSHSLPRVFDGKTINDYEVSSELDGFDSDATTTVMAGVGLACHEFSHALGLPDIYSSNEQLLHKTSGMWDIMDYGCYNNLVRTPAAYTAYERWFMGWLRPTLLNSASTDTLPDINSSQKAFYMTASGDSVTNIINPNPNVFYLFENRQQSGWDAGIPGHGMLITKVNFNAEIWRSNKVNVDASNLRVDIVEADGLKPAKDYSNPDNGGFGKPGDTYPTGSTTFTAVQNYQVTDIAETNGVITFKVNGGAPEDGETTAIDQTSDSETSTHEIIRNGQILILRGEQLYDLLGRKL